MNEFSQKEQVLIFPLTDEEPTTGELRTRLNSRILLPVPGKHKTTILLFPKVAIPNLLKNCMSFSKKKESYYFSYGREERI